MTREGLRELTGLLESTGRIGSREAAEIRLACLGADDVKDIREKMGLTQKGLSMLIGVSLGTIRHWEQGSRNPTGAARALLVVAAKYPKEVINAIWRQ